jgi:hypothetical protein
LAKYFVDTVPHQPCAIHYPISRDASDAKFKSWIKNNPTARARIVDNRLTLPDYQALGLFQLSWAEEWDLTVIWDSWQRRHIVIQ